MSEVIENSKTYGSSGNVPRDEVEKAILAYYKDMYRLAYSYVRNIEEAEDIVQESVYSAMKHTDSVKDIGKIKSFLLSVVVHKALDVLRKNVKVDSLDDNPEAENIGISDVYEDIDLKNALDVLSPTEKSVIMLRFFEDQPLKDIAATLNKNENTIKSILYRSLTKLKKVLENNEKEGRKNG